MIKIKCLELEGFRSFKTKTIINSFTDGINLISGKYSYDETLSSGAGKTNIPLAISYALGYCVLPLTELKSWNTTKFDVILTLQDGDIIYKIERNPKLSIIINGIVQSGSSAELELVIQKLLKTNSELASFLTYRPQRQKGKFLNSTDFQNKELLSELLGLSDLEKAHDELTNDLSNIKTTIDSLSYFINNSQSLLANPISIEYVNQLEREIKEAENMVAIVGNNNTIATLENEISDLRKEIQLNQYKIQNIQVAKRQNEHNKENVTKINTELESLYNNICPTCKQSWQTPQEIINSKLEQISQLLTNIQTNINIIGAENHINEILILANTLINEKSSALGLSRSPIDNAQNTLRAIQKNLNMTLNTYNQQQTIANTMKEKEITLNELSEQYILLSHAVNILSREGFLGVIFDELLQDIQYHANKMISAMPNLNNFSLIINSTAIAKTTGNTKKSITSKLFKNGKEINIKAVSGGQQCALEWCVDLAIAKAIRNRSGASLGWCCLDESMNELDVTCKYAAIKIIKENIDGQIIIIDHACEIKEDIDNNIQIVFDGENSTVL